MWNEWACNEYDQLVYADGGCLTTDICLDQVQQLGLVFAQQTARWSADELCRPPLRKWYELYLMLSKTKKLGGLVRKIGVVNKS